MAINYKKIIWNVSEGIIVCSAWNKNDTDKGITVTIQKNYVTIIPEKLDMFFKTSDGINNFTEGIINNDEFNIDLEDAIANQENGNVFVYLKFTTNGETITSPVFSIPVF